MSYVSEVCTDERDRGESGRSDGKALSGRCGRVAERVERVRLDARLLVHVFLAHFGDAASVVRDGTVRIRGEGDSQGGEHADSSDGDAVLSREGIAGDDGDDESDEGHSCGDEANAETLDENSGGASVGGYRDALGGLKRVGGAVFGEGANDVASGESNDSAAVDLPRERLIAGEVAKRHVNDSGVERNDQEGGAKDALSDGPQERVEDLVGGQFRLVDVGAHEKCAKDRREDAEASDPEGKRDSSVAVATGAPVGFLVLLVSRVAAAMIDPRVRLEEIGAHARDVADVVSDVISDDSWVGRVVLGDARFDLTDKIRSDVSSLGVGAAADASEESDGRRAKAEAEDVPPCLLESPVQL